MRRSFLDIPARVIAPAALALFVVIFLIVLVGSLGGDDDADEPRRSATRERQAQPARERGPTVSGRRRRVYVVKSGDTLVTIAERTGVEIERLIVLNPSVDPQGLVTGQRIKLRE